MNKDDYHGEGEIKALETKMRAFFEAAEYRDIDAIIACSDLEMTYLGLATATLTKKAVEERDTAQAEVEKQKERIQELEGLMTWFCLRVEGGQVRSKKTYKAFKEALDVE